MVVLGSFVGGGRGRGGFRVFYIQVTTPQLVVPRLSSCGGVAVVFKHLLALFSIHVPPPKVHTGFLLGRKKLVVMVVVS